jgi:quinolinate synthase
MSELVDKINKLKKEKNAVILAHNYQPGEIQDIADFNGDSLELARKCVSIKEDLIVFCGVFFMAESAKIINPSKRVLLPDLNAGCKMADMATGTKVRDYKEANPETTIVCYINSTAEVKAYSDVCVTSSNALEVIKKLNTKKIMFLPDQNLGGWVSRQLPEIEFELWPGYCHVHDDMTSEHIQSARATHPAAEVIVHPECKVEISDLADKVLSTGKMRKYIADSNNEEFIIGTETGMVYRLQTDNPNKKFHPLKTNAVCGNMKKITMQKLYDSLLNNQYDIQVDDEIARNAKKPIDLMLDLS